jgi:hypothetical protein
MWIIRCDTSLILRFGVGVTPGMFLGMSSPAAVGWTGEDPFAPQIHG